MTQSQKQLLWIFGGLVVAGGVGAAIYYANKKKDQQLTSGAPANVAPAIGGAAWQSYMASRDTSGSSSLPR